MREAAADAGPAAALQAPEASVESFEQVYRREGLKMVRVAFLILGSQQRAEEIVHDAFAQLLERWGRVERPAAYLRTSVINGCRSANRRSALERRTAGIERAPSGVGLGFDELTDALAALPVKRRAALVLRYYGDHSEAEIASALGVRPGTVKSLLHRGLAQLREVIER